MIAADIARILDARPAGTGRWMARCPAHEDRTPSLAMREAEEGRTLIHCHAGCLTEDVLTAAGLSWADLWPEDHPDRRIARQLVRAAYGRPEHERDPARRAALMLRGYADREGGRVQDDILRRHRQITHGKRVLDRDRQSELGWRLLADGYLGLAELEWLADLLDSHSPRDWDTARRYITADGGRP